MNITDKIHVLRKDKGWSVAKLARVCGIPTVSLRAMLSRDNPNSYNVKTLMRLSKALGVSVAYLTLEDDEALKPKLTIHQKNEIVSMFEKAVLAEYFDVEEEVSGEEK